MSEERPWEVVVEQITGKPETRIIQEMSTEELIEVLKRGFAEDHIIIIKNLKVP